MKRTIPILLLVLSAYTAFAQDKVVVSNSKNGEQVEIKYYCNTVFYDADINYYRKAHKDADWTKLNEQPVHWGDYRISPAIMNEDKQTRMLVTLFDSVGFEKMEGILLLLTLTNTFESEDFSKYLGIQFTDNTITNGSTYTYRVTRTEGNRELEIGISDPIIMGKYTPPLPPQDIEIVVDKRNIGLSWKPESTRYYGVNIYRNSTLDDTWQKVVEKPVMLSKSTGENGESGYADFFYKEQDLQEEVSYRYKLVAIDFFGNESSSSEVFIAPIQDKTPPIPPIVGEASVDHSAMNVNFGWTYPTEEVPDLSGFNIYRSTEFNGEFIKLNENQLAVTTRSFSNIVGKPSSYYYSVVALDYAGNESPSVKIYAEVPDIFPPAPPQGLTATGDTTSVSLKWQPNTEVDLKGYLVYRVVDNDIKNQVLVNASPITATEFIDELSGNTKNAFQYYVISVDTAFNKSEPSTFVSTLLPDATAPNKPFVKRVEVLEDGLRIQWLPAIDTDTEQFRLYRSSDTSKDSLIASLPSDITSYDDQSVSPNTDYDYYLIALDSAQNSSERSNTYRGVWGKANSITALGDISASYDSTSNVVQLSWVETQGINGYILYRKKGNAEFKPISGMIRESSYDDANIKKGNIYHYHLRSMGASGLNGESNSQTIEIK